MVHETRARICRDLTGITFFPCVLDEFAKVKIHFGSCVWFGVTCVGTETEESRSQSLVLDEGPGCNRTVTQSPTFARSCFLRAFPWALR